MLSGPTGLKSIFHRDFWKKSSSYKMVNPKKIAKELLISNYSVVFKTWVEYFCSALKQETYFPHLPVSSPLWPTHTYSWMPTSAYSTFYLNFS